MPQLADMMAGMHMGLWADTFPKPAVVSSAGAWGCVTGTWSLTAGCAAVEEHRLGATLQLEINSLRVPGGGWWCLGPAKPAGTSPLCAQGQRDAVLLSSP